MRKKKNVRSNDISTVRHLPIRDMEGLTIKPNELSTMQMGGEALSFLCNRVHHPRILYKIPHY
jgi:hypothetical protein